MEDLERNKNDAVHALRLINAEHSHIQISVRVFTRTFAQQCAKALRNNGRMKTLLLLGDGPKRAFPMQEADWIPFWKVMSTSTTLEEVHLGCYRLTYLGRFLDEINKSPSLKQ